MLNLYGQLPDECITGWDFLAKFGYARTISLKASRSMERHSSRSLLSVTTSGHSTNRPM